MLLIKRYPNRKLYDTAAKQYISLDRVAEFIRSRQELQVLDHATGEDLTTLILMQIIVEQEKRHSGFLPLDVITGLAQAGGNTLAVLRRSLTAPLDLAHQVDEEIVRRIEMLISRGDLSGEEGVRLRGQLLALGADSAGESPARAELEHTMRARGPATRSDVRALAELVERLSAAVDALAQDASG